MFRKITLFVLFTLLLTPAAFADPDLPGASANLETIPAGSLIIPMDTALQIATADGINDEPENFNIAAYGLANKMLQNNIPLKWAIRNNKVKLRGVTTGPANSTSLINASGNFVVNGVQVGDLITNVSKNPMTRSRVTVVAATTLTVVGVGGDAVDFDLGNEYVIDGYDFTATAERIRPGADVPAASVTFTSGPFIVSSENAAALAKALEIIDGVSDGIPPVLPTFTGNAAQSAVRVYRTTTPTNNVDVRYNLRHKPFVVVSNINTNIHADILIEAGIPGAAGGLGANDDDYTNCTPLPGTPNFDPNACNWNQINPLDLSLFECATLHVEPHRDEPSDAPTIALINTAVANFLSGGGNSAWQCHSVEYLENLNLATAVPPGKFMTSLGIDSVGSGGTVQYPNSPVPFSQMTGPLDGAQGGSVPNWDLNGGTYDKNEAYIVAQAVSDNLIHRAAGAKVPTGGDIGGNIFYLGGHNYDDAGELEQINGRRMLLNTLFVPADRDPNCGLTIEASLIIVKEIINDDGGTATVGDFGITTSAGALNFGAGVTVGDTTTYTADTLTVLAGQAFTLSESDLPAYSEGTWSCQGGDDLGGGDFDDGSVTLAPGDTKTCSITNNDIAQNPDITIDKEGSLDLGADGVATPGDLITYQFTVSNVGDVDLTNVSVTDPLTGLSAITCPGGNPIPSIAVGAQAVVCSATYPITQADIDAGLRDNTATAEGQCAVPACPVDDDDPNTETIPQGPDVEIIKSGSLDVGGDSVATPGDIISYTFDVTNTGNVTLYNLLVTDPLTGLSAISCPGGNPIPSLAPGATVQCTATYAIEQGDITAGEVQNLATVTANCTDVGDPAPCATDDDPHDEPIGQQPELTLVKTGDGPDDDYDAVADSLAYDFLVTNTGNVPLANPVTIDDDLTTDENCPSTNTVGNLDLFLDPGESITCTASYAVVQGDLDSGAVNNCATASAGGTDSNEDCATLDAEQNPDIEIDKEGTFAQGADNTSTVGDIISYTFDITNTGNITLWNVTVTDPLITDPPNSGTITCPGGNPITSMAPGATLQCTASYAITQGDIDAGERANTGTVTGDCTDDAQASCTTDDDPNTEEIPLSPVIELAKAVVSLTEAPAGTYTVVYSVTAENTGNGDGSYNITDTFTPGTGVTLQGGTATIALTTNGGGTTGTLTSPFASGATPVLARTLAVGQTDVWTITAVFVVNPATATLGSLDCDDFSDPATNTGTANGVTGSATDTDATDNRACAPLPQIDLSKSVASRTENPSGTFTVVYNVTAVNNGDGNGLYNIQDTFTPGTGVTLQGGTATIALGTNGGGVTGTLTSPFASGATPVQNRTLASGQTDIWQVTAVFVVNPATATLDSLDCDEFANPATNTGTANGVLGSSTDLDTTNNRACAALPQIDLAKSVLSVTENPSGTFSVVYNVTAVNNGDGSGSYNVQDTFTPGTGVTLQGGNATIALTTNGGGVTGTLTSPFASGATPVLNRTLASGATDVWAVTAIFVVNPATATVGSLDCDESSNPATSTGTANGVLGSGTDLNLTNNRACAPLPQINLAKTVQSTTDLGEGDWRVVYRVTATNNGDGNGIYNLVDTFSPGNGITLVSAQLTSYNAGSENSQTGTIVIGTPLPQPFASGANIVSGEGLAAGLTESWTITAEFEVNPEETDETLECSTVRNGENSGFHNFVEGSGTDLNESDNHACSEPELPVEKTQFRVIKDFTDDNPAHVEVEISCFTGLPLIQNQEIWEGRDVVFIVESFDPGELDCDISEVIPEGYSPTYDGSIIEGEADEPTEDELGCHFENVEYGEFLCSIVNTPDPVDVVIEKVWVIEGALGDVVDMRYKLKLYCDAEIVDGTTNCGYQHNSPMAYDGSETWCKTFKGDTSAVFTAQVIPEYPDSHCWVDEKVYDDAVEIDNDCQNLVVSAGHGDSCVITNTVFFEGIPTLNQYGMAILALLMLGVGLVGFRRFV